jgi:exosome complex protein LRP1
LIVSIKKRIVARVVTNGLPTTRHQSIMSLPVNTAALLDRFEGALGKIEEKLNPFLSMPSKELVGQLSPEANAKLNLAYSYGLNSLFYMHLKTQGVDTQQHPVKTEMERVKRYMLRTKEMEEKNKGRKAVVNVPAAGRMMKAALASNEDETPSSSDHAAKSTNKRGVKRSRQRGGDKDVESNEDVAVSRNSAKKKKRTTSRSEQTPERPRNESKVGSGTSTSKQSTSKQSTSKSSKKTKKTKNKNRK